MSVNVITTADAVFRVSVADGLRGGIHEHGDSFRPDTVQAAEVCSAA